MHTHESAKEAIQRLSKIEGHVRGIKNMLEEGKECEDILIQITAVQAALKNVSVIIMEDHMKHCIIDGVNEGHGEEAVARFSKAIRHVLKNN